MHLLRAAVSILLVAGLSAAEPVPADDAAAAAGINRFAAELYGQLRGAPGNLALSPFSIHLALGQAWAGAGGGTARAFAAVLHPLADPAAHHAAAARLAGRHAGAVTVANRLFHRTDAGVLPAFAGLLERSYGAAPEAVAFPEPGRTRINAWAAEATRGLVRDLLPPGALDDRTRVVLANAIHFLGAWQVPFEPRRSLPGPFTLGAGGQVEVPFMHREGRMLAALTPGVQVVELPYAGGSLAMDLLVPVAVDGLAGVEAQCDDEGLARLLAGLQPCQIELALPRFALSPRGLALRPALEAMGLAVAFSPQADFSALSALPLALDAVAHRAVVVVDEHGTEAAAATTATFGIKMVVPEVRADRPFLFLIRDTASGLILFWGRVADPR